jgi:thiol-disulfide isomerase/thioredoxin
MRNLLITGLLTLLLAVAMFLVTKENQGDSNIVKGDLPDLKIILTDSVTTYNVADTKGEKPVIFLFFSTTCDHCQSLAGELVRKKESLREIDLIMASIDSIDAIKRFGNQYSLFDIENLIIGKDAANAGIRTFQFESFPFCAIYNKQHKRIKSFERQFSAEDIIAIIRQ